MGLTSLTLALLEHLPRGRRYLADQLQRAAVSIPLNIAEGAGEFSRKDKRRFYRIALRSATASAARLDVCRRLVGCQSYFSGMPNAVVTGDAQTTLVALASTSKRLVCHSD